MANASSASGLQTFQRRDGGSPTMGLQSFFVASSDPTAIFSGDPVATLQVTPQSSFAGTFITQASSGVAQSYRGVFRGCEYYNTAAQRTVWSPYWPGSAAAGVSSLGDARCWVEIDDELMWTITASTWTVGSSMIGFNISVSANASQGNTTTGQSVVAASSFGTGSSLPFRLIDFLSNYSVPGGIVPGTDNSSFGQVLIVGANNFDTKALTGI